jgi:hypothetical protein
MPSQILARSLKTQADRKEKAKALPRKLIIEKASRILYIPFELLDISCAHQRIILYVGDSLSATLTKSISATSLRKLTEM